ncbi:MAG: hypothetical protein JO022_06640 [Acidobacteriaceae bacterium]|nr:hypothetical protein [Acidobacteriaceae bacterium]
MDIKIALLASDTILLDGQAVDLEQLNGRLSKADSSQDQVLYYKQDLQRRCSAHSENILRAVIARRLPISFSTRPDFSDYVDQFGHSHPRTGGSLNDPFAPFMPDINLGRNPEEVFAEARSTFSKLPEGRGVVLVGVDRTIIGMPVPGRSRELDARMPRLPGLGKPCRMAIIANTGAIPSVPPKAQDLRDVTKAIPFFGLIMALGYAGHRIWVFEGHPSSLEAGVRSAHILLVDSGMLPFLREGWRAAAQTAMDAPRTILVHNREQYALLSTASA